MKKENGLRMPTLANLANLANYNLQTAKHPADEQPADTPLAATKEEARCCFWQYKLNDKLPGFTQMGLMADNPVDAQKQLTEVYGRPVTGLRRKEY